MKLFAQVGGADREIVVEPIADTEGRWRVVIDGAERIVDARRVAPGSWSLHLGGEQSLVDVDPGKDGDLLVEVRGTTVPVKLLDPRKKLLDKVKLSRPHATGPSPVTSPMPGKVVKLLVKVDDEVVAGQGLVVVEAMKMENELRASRAGKIKAVHVKEGQPVEGQETLLTLE
jgi:biotin carboxyl carrier protein